MDAWIWTICWWGDGHKRYFDVLRKSLMMSSENHCFFLQLVGWVSRTSWPDRDLLGENHPHDPEQDAGQPQRAPGLRGGNVHPLPARVWQHPCKNNPGDMSWHFSHNAFFATWKYSGSCNILSIRYLLPIIPHICNFSPHKSTWTAMKHISRQNSVNHKKDSTTK